MWSSYTLPVASIWRSIPAANILLHAAWIASCSPPLQQTFAFSIWRYDLKLRQAHWCCGPCVFHTSRARRMLRRQGCTPWFAQHGVAHTGNSLLACVWPGSTAGAVVSLPVRLSSQAPGYTAAAYAGPVRTDDHGSHERRCGWRNTSLRVVCCFLLPRSVNVACARLLMSCRRPSVHQNACTAPQPTSSRFACVNAA